ncbi:energy transducer TonB [Carboxylicivirga mesophila]|uniref:Energy transducer TonB n=2 Tax=Carboxylicivirga TaxID=1628153 RepID=A0A941IWW5_9BACT|nr:MULTISPECIES: energy transducer TonB [Carboxylicivirga]MBR8535560.1 energy transducer TonB [Carboxylicivirga sediminis]MBS2210105.1 energy transducer TonB [Carboxylicivirga mesophila]
MEVKKSPKADLENKKSVFMQIGLVVTLAIVLIAFEWTTTDVDASQFEMVEELEAEEEIMPITRQEEVKPPPPPPPPKVADVLNIVEDDVELDEELDIEDTEMEEDTEIDFSDLAMEEEESDDAPVFFIVEDMPEFPGGEEALRKYIAQSVKYPVIAQENGIQGRVYVSFVVNTKGKVTDVKIARGVDPNLDKEAIRVVQAMPAWKPGKQRGKAVKVSYTVPINFVLQ